MTNSAAEPTALIRARGLTKVFGSRSAVAGIDFEVRDGEFFGFLGPNGAGKTTTMRMIAGVSPRTSGTLEIFGQDPDLHGSEIRGQIGVVHQQETLDMELTVRENLLVFGRFFGMDRASIATRADELLELFQRTLCELHELAGVDLVAGDRQHNVARVDEAAEHGDQ